MIVKARVQQTSVCCRVIKLKFDGHSPPPSAFPNVFVDSGKLDIFTGTLLDIPDLIFCERAFNLRRAAHDHRSGRDLRAGRDKAAGGDERVFADTGAVQNDCTDPDQTIGFHVTAVKRYAMTDRYVAFQNSRMRFRADVYHRSVLNVCSGTDADEINISAKDRAEPNACVLTDLDIADYYYVVGDVGGLVDFGSCIIEGNQHLEEVSRKDAKDAKEEMRRR